METNFAPLTVLKGIELLISIVFLCGLIALWNLAFASDM